MKLHSFFASVAVALSSAVTVFAQDQTADMLKIVPPEAIIVGYMNGTKASSGNFGRGLIEIVESNPKLKKKYTGVDLKKDANGECIYALSMTVNPQNPKDVRFVLHGWAHSASLGVQWDVWKNKTDKTMETTGRKFSLTNGKLGDKEYIAMSGDSASGYFIKMDAENACFKLTDSKGMLTPALPVFYDKQQQKPFVQKLNLQAWFSIAVNMDAGFEKIGKDMVNAGMIPPEYLKTHVVALSVSENKNFILAELNVYADADALPAIQASLQELLDNSKKTESAASLFLKKVKITKNADHVAVKAALPTKLILSLIESAICEPEAEPAAPSAAPAAATQTEK